MDEPRYEWRATGFGQVAHAVYDTTTDVPGVTRVAMCGKGRAHPVSWHRDGWPAMVPMRWPKTKCKPCLRALERFQ